MFAWWNCKMQYRLTCITKELEHHIRVFRDLLRSNWTRRATREILLSLPASSRSRTLPSHITIERVAAMRDPDWEHSEMSYQNAALEEVNAQIQRMNGMAPFAARRGYLMRKYELERCYEESAPEIVKAVEERLRDEGANASGWTFERSDLEAGDRTAGSAERASLGIWEAVKRLASKFMPSSARSTRRGAPSSDCIIIRRRGTNDHHLSHLMRAQLHTPNEDT